MKLNDGVPIAYYPFRDNAKKGGMLIALRALDGKACGHTAKLPKLQHRGILNWKSSLTMTMLYRAFFAGVCLAACFGSVQSLAADQPKTPPAKAAPAKATADRPAIDLPMKEFMGHVIAYSAHNIWNKQGWITDKSGERSLFPANDEEWEDAESASLTLSELIGLLLQPGRRINVPGWDSSALLVRKLALESANAAEKHDEAAFMKIGTELNDACAACHRAVGIE